MDGIDTCGNNSMCVNTVGDYNCSCNDGFTPNDDQRTCSRKYNLLGYPSCGYKLNRGYKTHDKVNVS